MVDLGELGYSPIIEDIFGINNANQAVFTAVVGGKRHAMIYLPADAFGLAAGVHDLHTLALLGGGVESAAHDINEAGIVVGEANNRAHVWRLDIMEFINLGLFPGGTSSAAFAINNNFPFPLIVGDGNLDGDCGCGMGTNSTVRLGFAIELRDPPVPLIGSARLLQDPNLPCFPNKYARDVRSPSLVRVAGFTTTTGEQCVGGLGCGLGNRGHAWIDPQPGPNLGFALNILGGGTQAWGVSDTGAMVGYGYTAANAPCLEHAVYWPADLSEAPLDLGSTVTGVDPGAQTLAVRINNNQPPFLGTLQAVGWDISGHGLLWECDGGCDLLLNWSATDINGSVLGQCGFCPPEWLILKLFDVNDNGWIIGVGESSSDEHAVLLVPLASCSPTECLGDIDGDGNVGAGDLLALLAAWGPCPAPPAACDADLDCDGSVGASDLLILLANWGPCGEPIATGPPQDILDCMSRFCCDPEDELALIKCLELVTQ